MKTTTDKAVKGTSAKAKETKEPVTLTFKKDKETKGAVRFVATELEASNIYFKLHELPELGLEGVEEFTVTINPSK